MDEAVESLDLLPPEGADYVHIEDKVPDALGDNELTSKKLSGNIAAFLDLTGYSKNAEDPNDPARIKYQNLATRIEICGQYWRPKECQNDYCEAKGAKILYRLYCDLPYCPTCGKRHSQVHKKRMKRVQKLLLGYPGGLGHWVFTLPKEISASLPSSTQINQLYKVAFQLLNIYLGAEAAMVVLHFCGDEGNGLHLHFDCTFPILQTHGNFFPADLFRQLRYDWTTAVNKIFGVRTEYRKAWWKDLLPWGRVLFSLPGDYEGYYPNEKESELYVGHYNYALKLGKQLNLLDYVTRSTIPAEKFIELTSEQKEWVIDRVGKKVIRYQGELGSSKRKESFLTRWQHSFVWELLDRMQREHDEDHGRIPAETAIMEGNCPCCGKPLSWIKGKPKIVQDDISSSEFHRFDVHTYIDRRFQWILHQKRDEWQGEENLAQHKRDLLEAGDTENYLELVESERFLRELELKREAPLDLASEES